MSFNFKPIPIEELPATTNGRAKPYGKLVQEFNAAGHELVHLDEFEGKDLSNAKVRSSVVSSVNNAAKKLNLPVKGLHREEKVFLRREAGTNTAPAAGVSAEATAATAAKPAVGAK